MKASYWPIKFETAQTGFSDTEIEALVSEKLIEFDKKLGLKRIPWLFWTTEVYSFGRCYRAKLGWPWFLPIPVYGDHGVCILSEFQPHERINSANYHLTWFEKRFDALTASGNKKIVRTQHPWVSYRRGKAIEVSHRAKGTLVFYSHSNEGIDICGYNNDSYIEKLKNLPEKFQPVVLCLHMHDVNKGLHKELRKYNIPVVTVGLNSSAYFVDRFYDLVSQFEYATSSTGGSELFLCHEMGVKFFVYGEKPKLINRKHNQVPKGELDFKDDEVFCWATENKDYLFSYENIDNNELQIQKTEFVTNVLGLDVEQKTDKAKLKKLFLFEMFKLTPLYMFSVGRAVYIRIKQIGLRETIKKIKGFIK